jgi:hypothetical protein
MEGGTMREPIACGLLIACAAVFPSQNAAGEEPSRRIVPARGLPNTVGRATGARYNPPNSPERRANSLSMTALTRSPANARPEWPSKSQPESKGGKSAPVDPPVRVGHGVESAGEVAITDTADSGKSHATPAEANQDAYLLPVLVWGYWSDIPDSPLTGLTTNPFPWWVNVDP